MNRKYTVEQFRREGRADSPLSAGLGDHDRHHRRFSRRSRRRFRATLDYVQTRRLCQRVHVHLFDSARNAGGALGAGAAAGVVERVSNGWSEAQNAATRAYHERKIGTTVRALIQGPSKKDAGKLAAKTLDNVTVIAPMPDGLRRSALRARTVARRRNTPSLHLGLHGHHRPPRRTFHRARFTGSATPYRFTCRVIIATTSGAFSKRLIGQSREAGTRCVQAQQFPAVLQVREERNSRALCRLQHDAVRAQKRIVRPGRDRTAFHANAVRKTRALPMSGSLSR